MHQEQYNKPLDGKFKTSSKDTLLENQVILSGLLLSNILLDFYFDLETAFWKIMYIQILVKIIVSFLLGCWNPLLPKFQSFWEDFSLFVFVTGDNTQTEMRITLLPSGMSSKYFFIGVDFVGFYLLIILRCINIKWSKILNLASTRISNTT